MITLDELPQPEKRRLRRRHRWTSWWASFVLHTALLGIIGGLLWKSYDPASLTRQPTITSSVSGREDSEPEPDEPAVELQADGRDVSQSEVDRRIRDAIDDMDSRDAEEKLSELDRRAKTLERVATVEDVDRISGHLGSLLGFDDRASVPADSPVEGEFDTTSAQLHDVQKTLQEDGSILYIATMIDSAGRTTTTELTDEEGETLFATMQKIKANPLLERIYRQLVMPLMDRMLAEERSRSDKTANASVDETSAADRSEER